jgi:hypothetical protein
MNKYKALVKAYSPEIFVNLSSPVNGYQSTNKEKKKITTS